MWFWYCSPFAGLWWIFPIMFLLCLLMMFFCMRRFFGQYSGCSAPGHKGWVGDRENAKPRHGTEEGVTRPRKEEC